MDLNRFRRLPLLGILRGIGAADVEPLTEAFCAAGLEAVEITMNTTNAARLIRQMKDFAEDRLMIGAGTVLSNEALAQARDAGASFIVTPVMVPEVIESCVAAGLPVFPGALTPQEIFSAWKAGAAMVKVFPANSFGPGYLKDIHGPFPEIELLAVGGITAENMPTYFANGARAVAFGGSVFRSDWLAAKRYDLIERSLRHLVDTCRASLPT